MTSMSMTRWHIRSANINILLLLLKVNTDSRVIITNEFFVAKRLLPHTDDLTVLAVILPLSKICGHPASYLMLHTNYHSFR